MNNEILYLFLVPAIAGILIFILGRKSRVVSETLTLLGTVITFLIALKIFGQTAVQGGVLTFWREELRMDALSGLIAGLVALLGLIASVYSVPYMRREVKTGAVPAERMRAYYGWFMIFLSTMLCATTINNIILLWVIIEGTTLASIILVGFYWNRDAIEAAYKYAILLTVGITFALFGCVLLYSGASQQIAGGIDPLKLTEIAKVAGKIPKSIVLLSVVMLLVGFGTKAGMVPFHTWPPDAHAEAPTPISAMLSGVMIKVGVYALIRTVLIFYPFYSIVSTLVLIFGMITMVVGVIMMMMQEDLKRFLAFCSVTSMGYILMGLGLANYLGIYGGIFHLLNHSLMKALAFLSVGAVIYSTHHRRVPELGGLGKYMPFTAVAFYAATLSLGGVPFFNGFISEFTLFIAGVKAGFPWATVIAVAVAILNVAIFFHLTYQVFMGEAPENLKAAEVKEVPVMMWGGMLILAFLCLLIGVYPQIVSPILNEATKAVFATIAMP